MKRENYMRERICQNKYENSESTLIDDTLSFYWLNLRFLNIHQIWLKWYTNLTIMKITKVPIFWDRHWTGLRKFYIEPNSQTIFLFLVSHWPTCHSKAFCNYWWFISRTSCQYCKRSIFPQQTCCCNYFSQNLWPDRHLQKSVHRDQKQLNSPHLECWNFSATFRWHWTRTSSH